MSIFSGEEAVLEVPCLVGRCSRGLYLISAWSVPESIQNTPASIINVTGYSAISEDSLGSLPITLTAGITCEHVLCG